MALRFIFSLFTLCAYSVRAMPRRSGIGLAKKASSVKCLPSSERSRTPHSKHRAKQDEQSSEREKRSRSHTLPTDPHSEDFGDVITDEQRRVSIAVYYVDTLGAPPEEEWDGHDGTVSIIMGALNIPRSSRVKVRTVLEDVTIAHTHGEEYSASRKPGSGGSNKLIALGSVEEQIAADAIEITSGSRKPLF